MRFLATAVVLVPALLCPCPSAGQDEADAFAKLGDTWGDRWYSVFAGGAKVGWFHLKVEKKGDFLVLTDELLAKPNREQELRIQSTLTAKADRFLTPTALSHKHDGPQAQATLEMQVVEGRAVVTVNGEKKQGEDGGGKLPSNLVTDLALWRIVTCLPSSGEMAVCVLDTLTKATPRLLPNGIVKPDGEETIEVGGRTAKARVFRLRVENFPDSVYWVDGSKRLLKCRVMGGGVEAILADEETAKAVDVAALRPAPVVHTNPKSPREIPALTGIPVFPGAEGFGTRTRAGRGGKVIEVTSLADSGPGTLRAALDDPEPRVIVFRVGGTIELEGELCVNQPFVTVAGQTAPGAGILIRNAGIAITTHDVLIQHLRIRPGNRGAVTPDNNDAICVLGPDREIKGACDVVLDHISASWGEDETVSVVNGARRITLCWSIVSEALNRSRHSKVTHSAGLLIGYGADHVSLHHNLLAHNGFRNPLISQGGTHDVVNNVIYDWGSIAAEVYDDDASTFLNFVGNTFVAGPSSRPLPKAITIHRSPKKGKPDPRVFLEDNWGPHRAASDADEWALAAHGWGEEAVPQAFRAVKPFATHAVTRLRAAEALEQVLARAGATAPQRDAVDARVIKDVKDKSGRIIDSPDDVGGYPVFAKGEPPADADHDGMSDEWERAKGLDPRDPADGGRDPDGNGYTNLEEYLHSLGR